MVNMIGRFILALVVAAVSGVPVLGASAPASRPGLAVKDGRLTKDGKLYRGVGANYFDLFLRVLHDPTNTSSLRGLERLGKAGIPFVRFATTYGAADLRIYFEQRDEFFRRLDLVVRAAERSKVG